MSSKTSPGRGNAILAILTAPAVWLERTRGRWRTALICLYAAIAVAIGMFGWRNLALRWIPNVGEPFADLPETPASGTPDVKFAMYQNALSLCPPTDVQGVGGSLTSTTDPHWNEATEALFKPYGEARDLWRRASEMEAVPASSSGTKHAISPRHLDNILALIMLCELEADRLEIQGDTAGAWRWHRAAVRSSFEIAANSSEMFHMIHVSAAPITIYSGVNRWATNPRVTGPMLESAHADLIAIGNRPLIEPEALRAVYRRVVDQLDHPAAQVVQAAERELNRVGQEQQWYQAFRPTRWSRWFLLNEPERGKRVTRLIFEDARAYSEATFKTRTATKTYIYQYYDTMKPSGFIPRTAAGDLVMYNRGKPMPAPIPSPGSSTAPPPKTAIIEAALESSPLLKHVLLSDIQNSSFHLWRGMRSQPKFAFAGPTAQETLENLLGLIDREIETRNLPPEDRETNDEVNFGGSDLP